MVTGSAFKGPAVVSVLHGLDGSEGHLFFALRASWVVRCFGIRLAGARLGHDRRSMAYRRERGRVSQSSAPDQGVAADGRVTLRMRGTRHKAFIRKTYVF